MTSFLRSFGFYGKPVRGKKKLAMTLSRAVALIQMPNRNEWNCATAQLTRQVTCT